MNKHKGCYRGFSRTHKHWTAQVNYPIQIHIGWYAEDGGATGEFSIFWEDIRPDEPMVARLECYQDSWDALWQFKDLLEALSIFDDTSIQEQELYETLLFLGIKDKTKYTKPKEEEQDGEEA